MEKPLAFLDFLPQLLHSTTVLLELLVVPPGGRMLVLLLLELDEPGLGEHLAGQVVLGGRHVMTTGHVGHRQSQSSTVLIAVTQLTGALETRRYNAVHLQTAELGMETDHGLTGNQQPEVVIRQAKQQRKLTGSVHFLHDHGWSDPSAQLGRLEAHQGP